MQSWSKSKFESYTTTKNKIMNRLKIKLLQLLLNNIFKYNNNECREKWMESTVDDITFLIK